jgi:hypothetical protein
MIRSLHSKIVKSIGAKSIETTKPFESKTIDALSPKWSKAVKHDQPSLNLQKLSSFGSDSLPRLRSDLEKVLFRKGPQPLMVNDKLQFNQRWTDIPQLDSINFKPPTFIPPSQDVTLLDLAVQNQVKYYGSTSSLSSPIAHLIVSLAQLNLYDNNKFSQAIRNKMPTTFTERSTRPVTIKLHHQPSGTYAIDSFKWDDEETILSKLGHVMERFLTLSDEEFKLLIGSPSDSDKPEEQNSYVFSKMGNIGIRAQLDCHHPKLPNQVFDLKTRATMPIRYDLAHYKTHTQYRITKLSGLFSSFEREYVDMLRAIFLKYSLQVRMGHMDGIFVAYHNTKEMFGFEYISLADLDLNVFGQTKKAEESFSHAVAAFTQLLDVIVRDSPAQSLNVTFHHFKKKSQRVLVFVANELNIPTHLYSIHFRKDDYVISDVTPKQLKLTDAYLHLQKVASKRQNVSAEPSFMWLYKKQLHKNQKKKQKKV